MTATDRADETRHARPPLCWRRWLLRLDRGDRGHRVADRRCDGNRPHDGPLLVVGHDVVTNGVLHARTALLTEPTAGPIGLAPGSSPGRAALGATRRAGPVSLDAPLRCTNEDYQRPTSLPSRHRWRSSGRRGGDKGIDPHARRNNARASFQPQGTALCARRQAPPGVIGHLRRAVDRRSIVRGFAVVGATLRKVYRHSTRFYTARKVGSRGDCLRLSSIVWHGASQTRRGQHVNDR